MKKTLTYDGKTFIRDANGHWIDSGGTGESMYVFCPEEDIERMEQDESVWEKHGWFVKMAVALVAASILGLFTGGTAILVLFCYFLFSKKESMQELREKVKVGIAATLIYGTFAAIFVGIIIACVCIYNHNMSQTWDESHKPSHSFRLTH